MTVVQLYCEGELHTTLQDVSLMTSELVLAGCSLNSNSHLLPPKTPGTEDQRVGNQTECALLAFVN